MVGLGSPRSKHDIGLDERIQTAASCSLCAQGLVLSCAVLCCVSAGVVGCSRTDRVGGRVGVLLQHEAD